jgi:hypothetical protein
MKLFTKIYDYYIMKKSIVSNINFKYSTWRNILFLSAFIIIALAISKYMPFYTEGFQEGLLSSTAITSLENALDSYDKNVDTICSEGVKIISKLQLSQADSATFSPILGDEALKNSAKIDKIFALKSTSDEVKKAIIDINSKKYTAVLTLLHTMNKDTYPDDETFTALLKQQTYAAQSVVNGENSVYSQMKDYLKTISIVS